MPSLGEAARTRGGQGRGRTRVVSALLKERIAVLRDLFEDHGYSTESSQTRPTEMSFWIVSGPDANTVGHVTLYDADPLIYITVDSPPTGLSGRVRSVLTGAGLAEFIASAKRRRSKPIPDWEV
jgi:hypothetical protein